MGNTLFGMMNTSATGLRTSQIAVNVTGNNIANAGNAGFSRQRIAFGAARPLQMNGVGFIGTGVTVNDIHRIRDQHLDMQIRNETSNLRDLEVQRDFLTQLETIFNEPSDSGLNQMMTDMWAAWDQLSTNPTDSTLQMLVQERTRAVADQFNIFTNQLNGTVNDIDARQNTEIDAAASIIDQINQLNRQIEVNSNNVLLDQRDALLGQLSEFMPVDVTFNSNNTVSITTPTADGSVNVLGLDGDGIRDMASDLTGGSLHGFEVAREQVQEYQRQINELASALASSINEIQVANGGEPMFIFDEENAAGTIQINPEFNDIVAAREVLTLRDTAIMIDGQEVSLGQFYQNLISDLGMQGQRVDRLISNQEILLDSLQERWESISGVSLDEEMINLIQFQAAYDANAQVMATITEMIDTIIHRLGA